MKAEFVRGFDPDDKWIDLSAKNFEEAFLKRLKKQSLWDLVEMAKEFGFTDLEIYTDD